MKNRNKMEGSEKHKALRIIPYLIILMIAAALWVRASYGFIWSDEPFYFSTALRFLDGDRPFVEEWYPAQIYSILLAPLMWIWKIIRRIDNWDGLFLSFRHCYVILQTLVTLYLYHLFRKKSGWFWSLGSSLIFLIFCKNNIQTLSYYAVGEMATIMALCLIYSGRRKVSLFLAGMCAGIAILCNPYQLVLFLIILIIFLYVEKKYISGRKCIHLCGCMILGAATVGVGLLLLGFRQTSLAEFLENLQYITSDPAYFGGNIVLIKIVRAWGSAAYHNIIILLCVACGCAVSLWKPESGKWIRIVASTGVIVDVIINHSDNVYTVGNMITALSFYGLLKLFLDRKEQPNPRLVWYLYLPGIVSSSLMAASSDTGYSSLISGMVPSAMAAVLMMEKPTNEQPHAGDKCLLVEMKRANYILLLEAVSLTLCICLAAYDRININYRDYPSNELKTVIGWGPARGIHTTEEAAHRYDTIGGTMRTLNQYQGNLYIAGFCPCAYLETGMRVGAYTTWRFYADTDAVMNSLYYRVHPGKYPDIVLILASNYGEYNDETEQNSMDHAPVRNDDWYWSWKNSKLVSSITEKGYRHMECPCGELYVKNSYEYDTITAGSFEDGNE